MKAGSENKGKAPVSRALTLALWLRRAWDAARGAWDAPIARRWRGQVAAWQAHPSSGAVTTVVGVVVASLLIAAINGLLTPLPNPGVVYLPLIAMLAYHWNWRYGAVASVLQLACVLVFFTPQGFAVAPSIERSEAQLLTLALVDIFILALVQLARARRDEAEREARRFAALNEVGLALAGELDEERLLRLIAQTARNLTGAGFAAFTLRPLDPLGAPLVPAEGNLFHLAAVVGVTAEQEAQFQRMFLGGEGLLAPIFRHGVSVRVADALAQPRGAMPAPHALQSPHAALSPRAAARIQAAAYASGQAPVADLQTMGVPRGHPVVRSFLGAPLLDRKGQVRGGLLVGHSEPDRFSAGDEAVLKALAAQAAVALENARLYHAAQTQARELDAVFESIADGVSVVDAHGAPQQENRAAAAIRASLADPVGGQSAHMPAVDEAVKQALSGAPITAVTVLAPGADGDRRSYLVSVAPLMNELETTTRDAAATPVGAPASEGDAVAPAGAVVVWHDVTETQRLLAERQAHAQAEAQRTLLQLVIDELPTGVYLARGHDARLALANRAAQEVWGAQWPVGQPMAEFVTANGVRIAGPSGQTLATEELATVRALHGGTAIRHHQEVIHRPDGTALPILFNAVALDPQLLGASSEGPGSAHALAGEPSTGLEPAALIVLQDMTALKEAEQLKDEFITVAAHELKTPMASVKGYADMLLRQSARDEQARLAPWQTEALETIDQATSRLVELTNDLLDVTRIQAGQVGLRLEPHDLGALVQRAAKRFAVTTDRHSFAVTVEGDASAGAEMGDFVVAELDVARTEQVVGNLLSNAIKYSPDGGQIVLTVRAETAKGLAELQVRDTGIGIPQAEQAQLFHRFSRAENARQLGIAGTGLGLYLCSELVHLQGGSIWFTSAEGQGTTFHVTLPLATEERS